ncbi:MAG: 3-dehydroquinate synthase [Bacteroidota bacterium]
MTIQRFQGTAIQLDFGSLTDSSFPQKLEQFATQKILILVDENTQQHCLEYLLTSFEKLSHAEVIVLPPGEETKSIEYAVQLWELLTDYEVTKNDLLICLGGGVVSDLGAFVASTYKRGLHCILIPTTLLAMIDAAIGGKNGIDFKGYKNLIGSIAQPEHIYIDPGFLHTLPWPEYMSGLGEALKHSLIGGPALWAQFKKEAALVIENKQALPSELLWELLQVKTTIVEQDPFEKGSRQILNLGHTLGHAFEAVLFDSSPIAHGVAVAWGLVYEAKLASIQGLLDPAFAQELRAFVSAYFTELPEVALEASALAPYLNQDKKNLDNQWRYAALKSPGAYLLNQSFELAQLEAVLKS